MNAIGPNWFAVVGLLILGCGLVFLVKSAAERQGSDAEGSRRAACEKRADAVISIPFLAGGLMLIIAAQFYSGELGGFIVALALFAATALFICWSVHGLLVERWVDEDRLHQSIPSRPPVAHTDPASPDQRPSLQIVHKV
jgi:hypothetical protein